MPSLSRRLTLGFTLALWMASGAAARADEGAAPPAAADAPPAPSTAPPAAAGDTPPPGEPAAAATPPAGAVAPTGAPALDTDAATAGVPMVDAAAQAGTPVHYAVGARLRWTSVPKWLLGLFLDDSVPLSSYAVAGEFVRRSGNFDLVLGLGYQALSPSDGNWLGKGNPPDTDTDFVQFRNLGAVSFDAAFILHTDFNENFGIHYGGGVGIGIMTGKMLRTSNGSPGCLDNPGSVEDCHPILCTTGPCTEAQLMASQGNVDGPGSPSRFTESRVPSVIPIVNVLVGLDVRVPGIQGFEMKVEGGYFFPYFFLGAGLGYRI
jgi:hypothetical protein